MEQEIQGRTPQPSREKEIQAFFLEAALVAKLAMLLWLVSDAPLGSPEEARLRAATTAADEALDRAVQLLQISNAA